MKTCDGCNKDKPTRSIWLVCFAMSLCQDCYRKLQSSGQAPKSISWDGSRVSP